MEDKYTDEELNQFGLLDDYWVESDPVDYVAVRELHNKMKYRQLTDKIDVLCHKKINWGHVAIMMKVFKWEHIKRCLPKIPQKVWDDWEPDQKARYLWAVCRAHAQPSDYNNKNLDKPFNLSDYKL